MSDAREGILASFDYLDSTLDTIHALREEGFDELTVFSPYPEHHIEEALGYGHTPVGIFTLVGGLTGAATGFALPVFTSLDWPMVVGGKPVLSMPAYVVIAFEMTILLGVLFTVVGVFWNMRVPDLKSDVVYDPELSGGRFGVYVTAPPDRLVAARQILESHDPARLEEDREAKAHG